MQWLKDFIFLNESGVAVQEIKNKYKPIKYYKKFKKNYLEFILFVKYGEWYFTYDADAKIVAYLFNTKLEDTVFKISKYDFQKTLKVLHENHLNVVLVGSKIAREYYTEKESFYQKIKKQAKTYFKNKNT